MCNLICNIKSPVMLKDDNVAVIPPVVFDNRIYILSDKKLYFVLIKINKLSDYLQFVRDEGYKNTYKWLNDRHLIGHEFLENISRYWLEGSNFNNTYKYEKFSKDKNHIPIIPEQFWNEYFSHLLVYDLISSCKDEFNDFVLNKLHTLSLELKELQNEKTLEIRREFYRNNIYNYLIHDFIDYKNINLKSLTRDINFCIKSKISNNDLGLYKIGGIKGYNGYKFLMKNVKYFECIKNNTVLEFELYNNYYDFQFFMNKSKHFCESKIRFEKDYILNILEKYSAKNNNLGKNFHKLYVDKSFSSLKGSNIVFLEESDYDKVISMMNLDKNTIRILNNILYSNKNEIYSLIVKVINNEADESIISSGYASIDLSSL